LPFGRVLKVGFGRGFPSIRRSRAIIVFESS
jgi:hypothetical protein